MFCLLYQVRIIPVSPTKSNNELYLNRPSHHPQLSGDRSHLSKRSHPRVSRKKHRKWAACDYEIDGQ